MGSVCSVGIDVLPQMARIDTDGEGAKGLKAA